MSGRNRGISFVKRLLSCVGVTIALAGSGCGSGSDGSCGTASNPTVMTLRDVTPPIGGTVVNKDIVQRFTVVNAPGIMSTVNIAMVPGRHTAGNPTFASQDWKVTAVGKDITYETTVSNWEIAPGHVEVVPLGGGVVDGCHFTLPSPLFSYDVTVN
jgi:hypothetical protein